MKIWDKFVLAGLRNGIRSELLYTAANNFTPNIFGKAILFLPKDLGNDFDLMDVKEKRQYLKVIDFMNRTSGLIQASKMSADAFELYRRFGGAVHIYTDTNFNTVMWPGERELFEFTILGLALNFTRDNEGTYQLDQLNNQIANIPMIGKLIIDSSKQGVVDALLNPETRLVLE